MLEEWCKTLWNGIHGGLNRMLTSIKLVSYLVEFRDKHQSRLWVHEAVCENEIQILKVINYVHLPERIFRELWNSYWCHVCVGLLGVFWRDVWFCLGPWSMLYSTDLVYKWTYVLKSWIQVSKKTDTVGIFWGAVWLNYNREVALSHISHQLQEGHWSRSHWYCCLLPRE